MFRAISNFSMRSQRWLGSKPISQVILILIAIAITPALVITFASVVRQVNEIRFVNDEFIAVTSFHPIEEITSHAAQRTVRGLMPEDRHDAQALAQAEDGLAEAVGEVAEAVSESKIDRLVPFWNEVEVQYTKTKAMTIQASPGEWYLTHEELANRALKLRDRVGVETGVILDPGSETYPMVDAMFLSLSGFETAVMSAAGHVDTLLREPDDRDARDGVAIAYGALGDFSQRISADLADAQLFSADGPAGYVAVLPALQQAVSGTEELRKRMVDFEESPSEAKRVAVLDAALVALEGLDALHDAGSTKLEILLAERKKKTLTSISIEFVSLAVFLALSVWLGKLIGRGISRSLGIAVASAERIASGSYDSEIQVRGDNETGRVLKAIGAMQDILKQRAAEAGENQRVKVGLDNVSSCVLLANTDGDVIYVNRAMSQMLNATALDLRREHPSFDPAKVVGSNMNLFDNLRLDPKVAGQAQIQVSGHTFRVSTSPVLGADGEWMGTVAEWLDRTQEVGAEEEIARIVAAASNGDLSKRIETAGKRGFFAKLAEGMNGIVGNMSTVVDEFNTVIAAGKNGDLTAHISTKGKTGAFEEMSVGVNALMESMRSVVQQIKAAAQEVASGSDEISKGNSDLSQRTEQQASSLEETASSMEEMTSTVKNNAENASQANQLAIAAREEATKGGQVVNNAITAMRGINDSSRKIADIISVIDEIAFQTNLLALNAAVEAARAGEQGRGFAVVASEVRNLAGRSATAAKEIKTLIQESVGRVEEGSRLVDQSGATLGAIVASIKKVSDIVAEISAASMEQSSGIEQVNKAIVQMDDMTQQNAALVEEAAAAAQSLREQANRLLGNVARFKAGGDDDAQTVQRLLEGGAGKPAAARPAAPRPAAAKPAVARSAKRPVAVQKEAADVPAPRKAAGHDSEWTEF